MRNFFLVVIAMGIASCVYAQSDRIYTDAYLNETNGPGYMGPLSDAVSANLNTQLFPFSKPDSTIRFHIGVIASRALIPSSMLTHTGTTVGLSPEQNHEVPTIFGENESLLVEDSNNNIYLFPGGFALEQLTFLVPQVSISGISNTDISARFFTWSFDDDFEDLTLLGLAIRHHIDQYFNLPDALDLSLGYAFNSINADANTIENTSHFAFAEASLNGNNWRLFANAGYVNSTLVIDYDDEETSIDFETNGTSNMRLGIGGSLKLAFLNLGVQADFFKPMVVSGYLGFTF